MRWLGRRAATGNVWRWKRRADLAGDKLTDARETGKTERVKI